MNLGEARAILKKYGHDGQPRVDIRSRSLSGNWNVRIHWTYREGQGYLEEDEYRYYPYIDACGAPLELIEAVYLWVAYQAGILGMKRRTANEAYILTGKGRN